MTKLQIAFIILLLSACNQVTDKNNNPVFGTNDEALWITYGRELPASDSLFYLDQPAPLFRKEFKPRGRIARATLYITAAGYYRTTLNGEAVGKNVLDPAWTDYSKRIYYSEYNVTSLLNDDNKNN